MCTNDRTARRAAAAFGVFFAGLMALPASASAFDVRKTPGGAPLRWTESNVSFVVNPNVDAAISGGSQAIAAAAHGWSGVSGAPTLSSSVGTCATTPAVDGTNAILFEKNFAPAGSALAVTLVSFDSATGEIIDTDIVVNAAYPFKVLPSSAIPATGTPAVSNEGSSSTSKDEDDDSASARFSTASYDIEHVVAHEIGHALGLADSTDDTTALMFPFTKAGDASVRTPSSDDLDGIGDDYDTSGTSAAAKSGCAKASVAGSRVRGVDAEVALAMMLCAAAWLVARRNARLVVPCVVAAVVLLGHTRTAHSSPLGALRIDATARVVSSTTVNVGGVFQTTVDLEPKSCHGLGVCPSHARAHVWGGTVGGITQVVGDSPVPGTDDDVDLTFGSSVDSDVSIVAVRRH